MARVTQRKGLTLAEVEAAIAVEIKQQALLQDDLQEALVAAEDTRPFRKALAEIAESLRRLQLERFNLEQEAAAQQRASITSTAREVLYEAHQRHADLLSTLVLPPHPTLKGSAQ